MSADDPIRFDRDETGRYALPPRPRTFAGMAWWEVAMVAVMAVGMLLTLVKAALWIAGAV